MQLIRKKFKGVHLIPLFFILSGCGTITRGTTQEIAVDSSPQGAKVQASNGMGGVTPLSITAARNTPLTVKITKAGYKDYAAILAPRVSGGGTAGLAGNIFVGGIIGMAVDAGSGAMYDLSPNRVFANLEKEDEYIERVIERVEIKPTRMVERRIRPPERIVEYRTEYVVVSPDDPRLKNAASYNGGYRSESSFNKAETEYRTSFGAKPEPKTINHSFGY